jgi:predicted transglutaminase-like cysteine proteinase
MRTAIATLFVAAWLLVAVDSSCAGSPVAMGSKSVSSARWVTAMAYIREQPRSMQLGLVNLFINSIDYGSDRTVSGRADEWIKPDELMRRGIGDCEDFAFAKYQALRELGVASSRLRLVYSLMSARDTATTSLRLRGAAALSRTDTSLGAHMVLVVLEHEDAEIEDSLVLDNKSNNVLLLRQRPDLHPVFAFNTAARWLLPYGMPRLPDRLLEMQDRLVEFARKSID